jgi:hypothetical protein
MMAGMLRRPIRARPAGPAGRSDVDGGSVRREAQVKTVLLIELLAISRKFIILEAEQYAVPTIVALAAVVVALGIATG